MRVAFLVPSLEPSGGVLTVVQHARLLRERAGIDAAVVVERDAPAAVHTAGVPVLGVDAALEATWEVAVATWWTTWAAATELRASRRVLFLQGLDERFYAMAEPFERLGASLALASADEVIAVSEHLRRVVAAARPGARCHVVRNGLDRGVFVPGETSSDRDALEVGEPTSSRDEALRVLVEGQPGLALKGVDDALAAVGAMRARAEVTLVALDPPATRDMRVHRVVGGLDAPSMASLYASSDVLVKLSRSEGLGLPPLEAAATGTPSVVTPYGGHEDWLRHGVNGVLVGFDDPEGTGAWLDALARDRDLRDRLGAGALHTAREWPTVEESSEEMAGALAGIVNGAGPDQGEVARSAARTLTRGLHSGRAVYDGALGALAWHEASLASVRVELDKLLDADRRLQDVLDSRTYRLSEALRRIWWRVRGRGGG
jgi:glycosyltransferase involved in cell wall biosynthesis